MTQEEITNLRLDIDELKLLTDQSKRQKVKDILTIETRRLETKVSELIKVLEADKSKVQPSTATNVGAQQPKAYDFNVKTYSWDQSDKFVKIYLTDLKNVQSLADVENDFEFRVDSKSVFFSAKNLNGRNCIFEVKELASLITPEKSEFKVKSDMVVLMLKKYATEKWDYLRMSDKQSAEKSKPKVPSLEKDADPSSSLMTMMKQMYEEGDDEMKRTIAKAWSESKNTSSEL